jgi:hypothetical protein
LEQDEHHLEQLAIWACMAGRRFPELQSKIRALLADRGATEAHAVEMIAEVNRSGAPPVGGPLITNGSSNGRAPTVNERMADILQSEPQAMWWMAKEWAEKLGMSATTVTLSETWMTTIKYSREMLKAHRSVRRHRK